MIKKVLLLALSFCCFFANAQTFSIDARIKGLQKGEKAYIMYRNDTPRTDTVTCTKNGRLTYSTPMDKMTEARLFIIPEEKKMNDMSESQTISLCAGGFSLEIKADKTALSSAQINGGVYQDPKHVQYFNSLKTFSEEREPIQMRLRALMAEKDVPEDQKEAFSKLISATNDSVWAVVAKERTFKEEWVKANPDDMFSAFVLKYSGSRKQKELFDSLSPAVQSSAVGKEISKQIKVSETFDQGRKNLKVGLAFTDFTLTDANGGKISLSDLKGKYTLVDFWGSWCGPCRQANKQMVEIYKKYGQRTDFEIIGMALDKVDAQWRDAIKKDSLVWHQVNMCEEKDPLKAVNIIHGIYMYPTKVLLDQHGIIIAIQLGDNIENDIVIRKLEEVFAL